MRLTRPPGVARSSVAGVVRLTSVTAAAAAACALWALPASASVNVGGTASAPAKHASTTKVSASPKTAFVKSDVKLSATIKSSGKTPTGSVTFWFGTRKLCKGKLSKGSTHCEAKFSDAATKTITGKYSGDSTHKASSGTAKVTIKAVAKTAVATTTEITAPNPIATQASGLPYTIEVVVTSTGGGTPTGTVAVAPTNLTDPGPTYSCIATLGAGGTGSCVVTPPTGSYGFTLFQATYSGDATHLPSATPVSQEHKLINPDNTTTTVGPATAAAGSVTLTATVVPGGGGNILAGFSETGGDMVTFSIGGTDIAGCVNVPLTWNGTVNTATCADTLGAGSDAVEAAYSGDEYTNPSDGTVNLVVS